MNLLKVLNRYKKRRCSIKKLYEYNFFQTNRSLLTKMPKYSSLNKSNLSEFDIFRANILLFGYMNKVSIESIINSYAHANLTPEEVAKITSDIQKQMKIDPHFQYGNNIISIPFFSKAINLIYANEPLKLLKYPFSSLTQDFTDTFIDPFDEYGAEIYNSSFTKLSKVCEINDSIAFFHFDTLTLYIVNAQGRLDARIVLFDRFVRKPDYNNMLERLVSVVNSYFTYDRNIFLNALKDEGFLSSRLYFLIKFFDRRKQK